MYIILDDMDATLTYKHTPTEYDIHPLLKNRWSPRSFSSQKIEHEVILKLMEAMRWAPSSMNEQPWIVRAGENGTGTHELLSGALFPGNRSWATKAPLLALLSARTTYATTGEANTSALYDLGLAVGNLSTEATAHHLSLHQMAGFDKHHVRQAFGIKETEQPVVIIAIGYRDDAALLPEALKQRETAARRRKTISEFVTLDLL